MSQYDNTYASFMLDYAAGVLSPAERLAGDLHRVLSKDGGRNAGMLDAVGGALLERAAPQPAGYFDAAKLRPQVATGQPATGQPATGQPATGQPATGEASLGEAGPSHLSPYIDRDLLALKWRRSIFGVMTLPAGMPHASLLRLDPGRRAPAHGHGRRDVTVVLRGAFADDYGVYERGDLAFAEPGMKHEPRAVGDESCVCLLAAEPGSGLQDFLGWLGLAGRRKEAA